MAILPPLFAATSSANLLAPMPLGLIGGELCASVSFIGAWASTRGRADNEAGCGQTHSHVAASDLHGFLLCVVIFFR